MSRKLLLVVFLLGACAYNEPRVPTDALRPVPEVKGKQVAEATGALEAEGFAVIMESSLSGRRLDAQTAKAECPSATVTEQNPAGGENVPKAMTITLTISGCP
ncbi:MAG TPA: PASTA domain-containing protein [Actinomycetota bacterium]|nr:PASTA domain-containing protein [Actinomycetota bacterium]